MCRCNFPYVFKLLHAFVDIMSTFPITSRCVVPVRGPVDDQPVSLTCYKTPSRVHMTNSAPTWLDRACEISRVVGPSVSEAVVGL
jgi:hypothetical protein